MSGGGLVCLVGFGVQAFLGGEALTEEEDLRFEMVVTDDFAAWQASDAISDAERHFQSWVRSAAGSTPFAYRSGVALISGRVPGEAGRLVGYSTFEANADSARAGAEQSAVNQLHALYLRQIVDRLRGKRAPLYVRASERVTRELLPTLVVGRFREAVERSYGRVFRAAILFDADDRLVKFNQRYRDEYSFAPDALVPGVSYAETLRQGYPRTASRRAMTSIAGSRNGPKRTATRRRPIWSSGPTAVGR